MFDAHLTVLAASRALLSAGRRIEISSAMMPMTTRSSTRVKPARIWFDFRIIGFPSTSKELARAVDRVRLITDGLVQTDPAAVMGGFSNSGALRTSVILRSMITVLRK